MTPLSFNLYIYIYYSYSSEENPEITFSTKRHVADETLTDDLKKSRVEEASEEEDKELKEEEEAGLEAAEVGPERPDEGTEDERKDAESVIDEYVIGKKFGVGLRIM